jgi:hypothetical protein
MRVAPIVCALAWSGVSFADAPLPPPSQIVQWSSNRQYVAVADPGRDAVAVYRVEGPNRTELWSISPWQRSFELADDGEHLVVCYSGLNLLPLDYKASWTMVTFYRRGIVVRAWTLAELVPDLTKLRRTASHYSWGKCVGFDPTGAFQVETVDRGTLKFNAGTGTLVQ